MKQPTYDIIGKIAIVKFDKLHKKNYKKKWADNFLKINPHLATILEKTDKIKGRLRIAKTKFIAGENTRETIYIEHGCRFRFNVDETYFSPRLSNDRKIVAEEILRKITNTKKNVLALFAGVAPYPIVLGKKIKEAGKNALIVSNELNRKASKYAEENVRMNKLENYVKILQGDAKNIEDKLKEKKLPLKYDFILMLRPNLKDTFLKSARKFAGKGTIIYYHGFGTQEKVLEEIKKDAGSKIGKINMRKAGEIAPFKYRWGVTFAVK